MIITIIIIIIIYYYYYYYFLLLLLLLLLLLSFYPLCKTRKCSPFHETVKPALDVYIREHV